MLKKRIIAPITLLNNIVVQSKKFNYYLPIGDLSITVDYLNQWGADEILIHDITPKIKKNKINILKLKKINNKNYVPICYGGGINSIDKIRKILNNLSDKISINNYLLENQSFVTKASRIFGSQSIVASVDIYKIDKKKYKVFDYKKNKLTKLDPIEYSKLLEDKGAGELVLKLVNNDGVGNGYEIDYYNKIISKLDIPVIVGSGVGSYDDLKKAFLNCGASGYAVGNFWNYKEHSIVIAKKYLSSLKLNVRNDTYIKYSNQIFKKKLI